MKLCPKCQKQFSDDANFCPVDAARLVPLDAGGAGAGAGAAADSLAQRFDLGPKLGGSRTGAVHRATDKTTGKPVVVKLVSPAVIQLPGVAQRIERELRQLERVQSAGVARVLASGKRQGSDETWVAMELLDGAHTLEQAITARGPIPADQAADLIEVVGEALIEAAQVGVVHRDLAPKNVLFAGQDVKLINFSLPVPTEKVPGIAEFVAPEQVDGRPVDQRSNLYSLGALYYYVLTGQTVFAGGAVDVHKQHQTGTIRPVSQLAPAIAAGSPIETVIMRALDRSPTKRFLTVRQFVDEVGRVGHGEVIELNKPAAAVPRAGRPKGDLVQTLMGVSKGGGGAGDAVAAKPAPAQERPAFLGTTTPGPGPSIANAPTVGVPAAPIVPVAAQPAPRAAQPAVMQQTMIGVATGGQAPAQAAQPAINPQPAPVIAAQQSPWAPPQAQAQAAMPQAAMPQAPIVPQAPVMPMPQPQAPVMPQAPVVAAPVVAQQPSGKKKADEPGGQKGKFRETMWFKKGDLDAQAAVAAAEERARTGKDVSTDKADSLPMDERYKDDGSISRGDKEKYSLRTGATQMMQALRPDGGQSMTKVSEDALIGEMKSGRGKIMIAIAVAVLAIIIIIVMVAK